MPYEVTQLQWKTSTKQDLGGQVATQIELPEITRQMEVRQLTPMALMMTGIESGKLTAADLQILQEMHFKQLSRDAESEFNIAMNAVQAEITRVIPDAYNQQTRSKWATYAALDKMLRPIYTRHGFSLSFDSGDSPAETVIAYCFVSHCAGHTRKYQSPATPLPVMGPQGKAVMTTTHGTGAAMSYAKRYLLTFIFNIPVGDEDTDGNGPDPEPAKPTMDAEEFKERFEFFPKCSTLGELHDHWRNSYGEAKKVGDRKAMDAFNAAKDERKTALMKDVVKG